MIKARVNVVCNNPNGSGVEMGVFSFSGRDLKEVIMQAVETAERKGVFDLMIEKDIIEVNVKDIEIF